MLWLSVSKKKIWLLYVPLVGAGLIAFAAIVLWKGLDYDSSQREKKHTISNYKLGYGNAIAAIFKVDGHQDFLRKLQYSTFDSKFFRGSDLTWWDGLPAPKECTTGVQRMGYKLVALCVEEGDLFLIELHDFVVDAPIGARPDLNYLRQNPYFRRQEDVVSDIEGKLKANNIAYSLDWKIIDLRKMFPR